MPLRYKFVIALTSVAILWQAFILINQNIRIVFFGNIVSGSLALALSVFFIIFNLSFLYLLIKRSKLGWRLYLLLSLIGVLNIFLRFGGEILYGNIYEPVVGLSLINLPAYLSLIVFADKKYFVN